MWKEMKALFTGFGLLIIGIGFGFILLHYHSFEILIIGMIGTTTILMGDMVFFWKLGDTDADAILEPNGPGEKTIDLHLIGGGRRFIRGKKGPLGTYVFMFHGKKAGVVDTGSYPTTLPSGNSCIVAHESYDMNLNYYKAKALEILFSKYNVNDIIDLYKILPKEEVDAEMKEKVDELQKEEKKNA